MLKKILGVGGVLMALMLVGFAMAVAVVLPVFAQTAVAVVQAVNNQGYGLATWEALAKHTAGAPASTGAWRGVKTVQIIVTGAGEQNLTIQGSMNGTNWVTLHGVSLDSGEYFELTGITASGLYAIIEDPLYVRPLVSNEAGATAVDIDVIVGAYAR